MLASKDLGTLKEMVAWYRQHKPQPIQKKPKQQPQVLSTPSSGQAYGLWPVNENEYTLDDFPIKVFRSGGINTYRTSGLSIDSNGKLVRDSPYSTTNKAYGWKLVLNGNIRPFFNDQIWGARLQVLIQESGALLGTYLAKASKDYDRSYDWPDWPNPIFDFSITACGIFDQEELDLEIDLIDNGEPNDQPGVIEDRDQLLLSDFWGCLTVQELVRIPYSPNLQGNEIQDDLFQMVVTDDGNSIVGF